MYVQPSEEFVGFRVQLEFKNQLFVSFSISLRVNVDAAVLSRFICSRSFGSMIKPIQQECEWIKDSHLNCQ